MSLVLLLLFELFLCQSLLQELSHSFLFHIHWLFTIIAADGFACDIMWYWVAIWIQFISISIDVVLLCLWSELLLAFRLRLFKVCCCVNTCAVIRNQTAVIILDYGYTVRLATLLRICDHFYRPCWLFILFRIQALLLKKSLISSELAKDQILICVSLILLDE